MLVRSCGSTVIDGGHSAGLHVAVAVEVSIATSVLPA
jgi:hypothetical protein